MSEEIGIIMIRDNREKIIKIRYYNRLLRIIRINNWEIRIKKLLLKIRTSRF